MKIYDMKKGSYASLLVLIILFSFSKANAQEVPKNGLIAWFPFNGTINDVSENGNRTYFIDNNQGGIILNDSFNYLTDDRNGNAKSAFSFNGINENKGIKVKLPKTSLLLDRTISLWVKSPSHSIKSYSNIFEMGNNSEIKQYCSILGDESSYVSQKREGKISNLIAEGGYVESRSYLNDDNWHHLAIVVNSKNKTYKIYIDGMLDSDSYLQVPITNNLNPYSANPQKNILEIPVNYLVFGNVFRNDPSCAFGGKIDDIGLWNRALNESEIFQLFNNYYTANSKPNVKTDRRIKLIGQDSSAILKSSLTIITESVNSTNSVTNNNYIQVPSSSENTLISPNNVELNKKEFEKLLTIYNSTTSYNSTFSGNIKPHPSNPSESFYKKDYYNNQLIYDGYMKEIINSNNGNTVYKQQFKHGMGKEYFINSTGHQEGFFVNGKLNGYGEHISNAYGFSYKGYFENGVRSGEGILVMDGTNGTTKYIYEGMFSNGVYNGKGTLTYNFMAYTGSFIGGIISGLGVYLYPDGSKYVGNSLNGKYEGQGEYYSANGNYYVGNFYNGSYNGLGEFTYANGTKQKGVFENNVYKGEKKEVPNNSSITVQNSSNSNENQSPSKQYSSNQKCNMTFQIPVLPFKYVDNRVLCIYCGTRYIPYSKIDVNEYKKGMTLTYVSKKIDEHCEEVGADNNHKASHIIQIGNLCVKKGYFKTTEDAVATIITGNFIGKQVSNYFEGITSMLNILQQALGSSTQNNQANEFTIKLYDNNNTKFCTREHEDRYNRRY